MSIILRENEWAEEMIRSRQLGKKPSETLYRVARYYLDAGYSKAEVRKKMDIFLIQSEPTASIVRWSNFLDQAVKRAAKHPAIDIENIVITKPEIEKIDSLDKKQARRLAFTLLCLAKYWNIVNPNGNSWVVTPDNEIMSMANINTSLKRQGLLYRCLREQGLVQFSKKVDNTNVRVLFIEDGEPVMYVSDFRNLGYQYLKYCGEPFFECMNCGITVKYNDPINGRMQKYCKSCAVEVATQQKVNHAMRSKSRSA